MARETTESQSSAVRGALSYVGRDRFTPVRPRKVDQCRCQNRSVFSAIGLRSAQRSLVRRVYGMRLVLTFALVAMAPGNTASAIGQSGRFGYSQQLKTGSS